MTRHMFFTTISGSQYPVAGIAAIWPAHKTGKDYPNKAHTVVMSDDKRVEVDTFDVKAIINAPQYVIPAEPGTFLLSRVDPGDTVADVWRTPVLAWAICGQGFPTPITVDGLGDGLDEEQPILLPAGSVCQPGCESWRTFDAWFAEALKAAEKREADKAATVEGEGQ